MVNNSHGTVPGKVYQISVNGITTYLFDGDPVQRSEMVYSIDNLSDGYKYTFFSLAVLNYFAETEWKPDIYHANDWHTAPLAYALKTRRKKDKALSNTKSILTVHNLPFMGAGSQAALAKYCLPPNAINGYPTGGGNNRCRWVFTPQTTSPPYHQHTLRKS
jgi:starch synthase